MSSDKKPTSGRDQANAFLRRIQPSLAALAAGFAVGSLFRQDVLLLLIDPWVVDRNVIYHGYPSPERVSVWFHFVSAIAGVVVALPWLILMAWRSGSARSTLAHRQSGYVFILSSYVALGVGLGLAALVVLPAVALRQREASPDLRPVPWAFVDLELSWTLGIALALQLGIALFAFARIRRLERRNFDDGAHLRGERG